ncbi:MAG: hypothetical protein WDW38_010641 [Sanguina aurantia]
MFTGGLAAIGVLAVVGMLTGLSIGLKLRAAAAMQHSCPPGYSKDNVDVTFFVVRFGTRNRDVISEEVDNPTVEGDNFYPSGLRSTSDPDFANTFTNVYSHPSLQVPWYGVLGNHDYGDQLGMSEVKGLHAASTLEGCLSQEDCFSPVWQTGGSLMSRDARWHAQQGVTTRSVSLGAAGQTLDIIMLDTSPLIPRYRNKAWAIIHGGVSSFNATLLLEQSLAAIRSSSAAWKLVVGHHPMRSAGEHCSDPGKSDW